MAFFRGASLDPLPPVGSKQKDVRYFHIHEDDALDEARLAEADPEAVGTVKWGRVPVREHATRSMKRR